MKIDEVRASFTIYVIASDENRVSGIAEHLGAAGYLVVNFADLTQAFSEFYSNPPHFLLFDALETTFDLTKAVQQVAVQLPESHIFLVVPIAARESAIPYLDRGVYELILTPVLAPVELVRTMDRAAERDYFMYLNERLMESQNQAAVEIAPAIEPVPANRHLDYARGLFATTSLEECMQFFLENSSELLGQCPVVYFRYINNRRVIMAGQSHGVEGIDLGNIGMNLNDVIPGFRANQLREPMQLEPFTEMVKELFEIEDFFARPVEALGEIQGVVCFLTARPSEPTLAALEDWLLLLNKALSLAQADRRLHVVALKDWGTDVLNRQTFLVKMNEEISRARRTKMPISMVSIAVDQYGQVSASFGKEEAQLVLRTAARILEKHSRVNDIVGRMGVDEFGLLLPHTNKEGAMVKAERLRRIIESADFSKVLSQFPRFTISLGVSEYPTMVRDSEELLQSADEALFHVRKVGNRTGVSTAPPGFEPDFAIEEKVP